MGDRNATDLPTLPGQPIVVPYAPQLALLKQSSLVITHAGLNTTLEALAQGVPLIAIPLTHDEPAIAARIVWNGVGERLSPARLRPEKLRALIQQVLNQPHYRQNAMRLQQAIAHSGGTTLAADILEKAIHSV